MFHSDSKICHYSEEYYIYDNPTVSDFEYDALLRELEDLEKLI